MVEDAVYEALEEELAEIKDELENLQQENQELNDRVIDLARIEEMYLKIEDKITDLYMLI